ncbi:Phosphoribosylamine--glycine ligase [subsurface metagenome]
MTHAVEIPQVVAKVAKALNLPGLDPEVSERATNKWKRLKCLTKNAIPCAKFEIIETIEEAEKKADKIGFPVVFKPVDNAGARGVIKVRKKKEIKDAFAHTKKYTSKEIILIEEYLEGKELSTESLIYNKTYTVAFADRNYDKKRFEPFFIEDGAEMPTSLSKDEIKKVTQTVDAAIRALGIDWGVAKGDVIIDTKGKVKILEMAARTSGGRFCSLKVPLSTGINMLRPLILMSAGITPDLDDLKPKFSKGIAERFIFPEPGKIVQIKGIEEAKKMEGIYKVHIDENVRVGKIIEPVTDHTKRKGYVIGIGKTREEAIDKTERAVQKIEIITIN